MREVFVYDSARRPCNWNELLRPSQVAVFFENIQNESPCSPTGASFTDASRSTCFVFDGLEEAREYCQRVVSAGKPIRCLAFDRSGRGGGPIFELLAKKYEGRGIISSRFRRWSIPVLVFLGTALTYAEWKTGGYYVWMAAIGSKLLLVAVIFTAWELVLIFDRKRRSG